MKQIKTEPCVCQATGKQIECDECAQTLTRQGDGITHKGCNNVPLSIREKLKCGCGVQSSVPLGHTRFVCPKCKSVFEKKGKLWFNRTLRDRPAVRNTNEQRKAQMLTCDCGNKIPISDYTTSRKCFKCNTQHEKIKGVWKKMAGKVLKDTMTLGDVLKAKGKISLMG